MKSANKVEKAMQAARAVRREIERFGEPVTKMSAITQLAYRVIRLEERLAGCNCKNKENRP